MQTARLTCALCALHRSTFDKPLPLAILKAVSVVTCMDGRLMPVGPGTAV